ncbi:MAG: hypothetical protein E7568_05525 [Ruminococcaceae bacterium]|nr:hypothetical protein [Oscillospiraceae bacterium]
MFEDDEFNNLTLGNDSHSLGFTHVTEFKFVASRNATEKDFEKLSNRKNLIEQYFVENNEGEYTLHYTDGSCKTSNNVIYVKTFSESSLFRAGFCKKCFPEMYIEN